MMEDESNQSASPSLVTIKAVYCPGSSQEEIRRFNYPLPACDSAADQSTVGGEHQTEEQLESRKQQQQKLFDDFRHRLAAAFAGGAGCPIGLSLYYVDADQERVRFSTGDELRRLLWLHHTRHSADGELAAPLRIIAAPTPGCESDGAEHPGVLCDGCNQPLRGRRFRCFLCPDYDLCQRCVLRGVHDQHSMLVLHRPGDADSLPPWLCRGGPFGAGGRGGPWPWSSGGWPGRFGHPQQQQQQQQQSPVTQQYPPPQGPPHMRHYGPHVPPHMPPPPPPPHGPFGYPTPPRPGGVPTSLQTLSASCPKLARKLEKARCKFEAKMAERCERMQRKWAWRQQMLCLRQQHQQQQQQHCQKEAGAAGTADEPIRIDIEEQEKQQQQQQQQLTPEEALLLKQLQKRHKQAKKKQHQQQHHRHHKRGRGGRKRRRSRSSSSSSSSNSSDSSSDSGSSSASDFEDVGRETPEQRNYRKLLKKFRRMGFKDDETCWLSQLIREKRGNLNDILDAIRQRKAEGRDV